MSWRRFLAVAGAALVPALAVTPVVAAPPDETFDADTAVITGEAGVGVLDVHGGSGDFNFTSDTCTIASSSGATPRPCTAIATGEYANLVCGTGVAEGTGTLDEGAGFETYTAPNFTIFFTAGVGLFYGEATESDADGGGTTGAQPVVGTVDLVPSGALGMGGCTTSFSATAELTTTA